MTDRYLRRTNRANIPQQQSPEYQRFKSEYFSGADVRIYFGDIWLDEVTNLQFSMQEQVSPIFGYASYTWDKVARGTRYIQGSFTINFKESYYLHSVLNGLRSKLESKPGEAYRPPVHEAQWRNDITVEHLLGTSKFDAVADEFEKSLWGKGKLTAETRARSQRSSYFTSAQATDDLNETGFNILISYGPLNEAGGTRVDQTIHSLVGVQLTGCAQIIGGDGQPIQEQYSFIAKDLDGDASR